MHHVVDRTSKLTIYLLPAGLVHRNLASVAEHDEHLVYDTSGKL